MLKPRCQGEEGRACKAVTTMPLLATPEAVPPKSATGLRMANGWRWLLLGFNAAWRPTQSLKVAVTTVVDAEAAPEVKSRTTALRSNEAVVIVTNG